MMIRRLNLRRGNAALDASKYPTLIPADVYQTLAGTGAYEFVEHLVAPVEGDGGIYTPEFFESFLGKTAQKPIPGDKLGHRALPVSDFYTIGGQVDRQGDVADVYLKILIPATGYNGESNEGLVRDVKARVAQFSIMTDAETVHAPDGKCYIRESLGNERNDRVTEGAMYQDLLANGKPDEQEIMALVEAGAIDMDGESETLVSGGKVNRWAAVRLQSSADYKALAGRVLNAIAERTKRRMKNMTKQEIIEAARAAITNNELTLEELAETLKMENKLKNTTDEQRAKLATGIAEALGLPAETPIPDLLKAAEEVFKEAAAGAEQTAELEAASLANGRKLKAADGTEVDNPAYTYAREKLRGKRGVTLKNAATALKQDVVLVALLSKAADGRVTLQNSGGGSGDQTDAEVWEV
jgi:hypothetical protein